MEIKGLFTAIVTPFDKRGNLDEEGLRENIEFQIENGVDGIVAVGTTGESATLTEEEHKRVLEISLDQVNDRCLVIGGTGSNNTAEALNYTKHAYDIGLDAVLMITPYYNKPTQEGLYRHYKKIADSIDIPIILYTVPSRTMVNIEVETTKRLSEIPNIVAIKDASGDLNQVSREIMECGGDFSVLSGDDSLNLPIIALGGKGAISVASNIVPKMMSEFIHSALNGDFKRARELHYRLYPLFRVLFIETNPAPVKAAMEMMGMPSGNPRLPLVEVSKESKERIKNVLESLNLL
ncbi:MAG: 4-hydroxy-tetrahydrodipicolinate synthase [Candidatus Altiarchaeales archaeon]|nr:MAG: 4-hydroxy-tetrahydrodipicolinate synthase [Candidatus Altiarchaeales archaeon]RLI93732.1 MAG: 4-hydroxy-tetrahydrodipicolinate synthase [Candidatus Altiarchaeales archaeon]